jgi:hypothetical protein
MIDLDKLEALAKAATSGPWFHHPASGYQHAMGGFISASDDRRDLNFPPLFDVRGTNGQPHGANAAYLEGSNPATILALIAEVRALRERVVPNGFAVMPIEPTDELLYAGYGYHYRLETTLGKRAAKKDYAELIKAARGAQ